MDIALVGVDEHAVRKTALRVRILFLLLVEGLGIVFHEGANHRDPVRGGLTLLRLHEVVLIV